MLLRYMASLMGTSTARSQKLNSNEPQDPQSHKITDFFSFYSVESSVINNKKHDAIRAAYLFYYATEKAFEEGKNKDELKAGLKGRLNAVMHDALVIAKGVGSLKDSTLLSFRTKSSLICLS